MANLEVIQSLALAVWGRLNVALWAEGVLSVCRILLARVTTSWSQLRSQRLSPSGLLHRSIGPRPRLHALGSCQDGEVPAYDVMARKRPVCILVCLLWGRRGAEYF